MLKAAKNEVTSKQPGSQFADFAPPPDELLDFTESLETYAKEVLHEARSSRRWFSNHASTSAPGPTSERALPEIWRHVDSHSRSSSHRSRESSNARTEPSHAASSSVSASTRPSSLSQRPITISDSMSDISSTTQQTIESFPSENNVRNPKPNASTIIEHRDMKAREYINDPNGDILSRPKVKPRAETATVGRSRQIGRHTITLDATRFRINNHSLKVENYAVADAFFQTLLHHKDKLDALDEALAIQGPEDTWEGIPGWLVDSRGVTMQASALGIREV